MMEAKSRPGKWMLLWFGLWCAGAALAALLPAAGMGWLAAAGACGMAAAGGALYACWMTRLAGGLKGWQFGLLFVPGFGLGWNFFESQRIVGGILRYRSGWEKVFFRIVAGVAALALLAAAGYAAYQLWRWPWLLLRFRNLRPALWPLAVHVAAFAVLGWRLNRAAWRIPPEPTSRRRRQRQLALIFGLCWVMPVLLAGGWWGWNAWRIRTAWRRIEASGLTRQWLPLEEWTLANAPPELVEWRNRAVALQLPGRSGDAAANRALLAAARPVFAEFKAYPAASDDDAAGWALIRFHYYTGVEAIEDGDDALLTGSLDDLRALEEIAPSHMQGNRDFYLDLLQRFAAAGGFARLDREELKRLIPPFRPGEGESEFSQRGIAYLIDIVFLHPDKLGLLDDLNRPWWIGARADTVELMAWTFRAAAVDKYRRPAEPYLLPLPPDYLLWEVVCELTPELLASRDRYVAEVRVLRMLAALELFRRDTGRYPESQEQLVPAYLDSLPVDPWDGKPLRLVPDPAAGTIRVEAGPASMSMPVEEREP